MNDQPLADDDREELTKTATTTSSNITRINVS